MEKISVIIIDSNQKYLFPLEFKFMNELQDNVEVTLISDPEYFRFFFEEPKTATVLITSEEFYTAELWKHNITRIVVLEENNENAHLDDDGTVYLDKYMSVDGVFSVISQIVPEMTALQKERKETEIILVGSAAGGTGKTTVALGIGAALVNKYLRVLYVNAAQINSFTHMLKDKTPLPGETNFALLERDKVYENLKPYLRKEELTYLPPFANALMSYGENLSLYADFVSAAKESGDYDIIIVDMETSLDSSKTRLIELAGRVLMVMRDSAASIDVTNSFMKNVSKADEKYAFICNGAQADTMTHSTDFAVSAFIRPIDSIEELGLEQLGRIDDIQKAAYLAL